MKVKFRKAPKIQCEDVFEDNGPHAGCAEFAPTAYHRCRDAATHWFRWFESYTGESGKIKMCKFHADMTGEKVYRFRKI